ncbi:hypothetical protein F5B19DRAFT_336000 [Rostrohypoxylon terebratum]|nr:hypothetical protein F5B19DRAFT_336000 [Rostrohypoxylon terebratum]
MPHIFEYIIKTSPSGRHHTHHHHHDSHYRTGVPVERWNGLVEQNHELASSNEALTRENQTLKSELQTASQENARLSSCNQALASENCSLRRSRSTDSETAASFRRRIAVLSKEVDDVSAECKSLRKRRGYLETRIEVLNGTVEKHELTIKDLTRELLDWQTQADKFKALYEKYKRKFLNSEVELDLKNRLVEDQSRRLRHLESPLPFRRGRRYSCA